MPGLPVHHQLLEPTQTRVHRVGDAIQPSHPLLSPSPPAFNLSVRVFSNESVLCIREQKYWSFSFSICVSSEYSRLISFRIDWLDLLAVQETLKSLLQHHSSKASILRRFNPSAIYQIYYLPIEYLSVHLSSVNLLSLYCLSVYHLFLHLNLLSVYCLSSPCIT